MIPAPPVVVNAESRAPACFIFVFTVNQLRRQIVPRGVSSRLTPSALS